jgi:hypothetical protein
MNTKRFIFALVAGLALSGAAQAVLVDNGGGLIYDSTNNITWLQDANLAASDNMGVTGVHADGSVDSWFTAIDYIAAMNAANYLGHSDWRLPTMQDNGAAGCQGVVVNGTDDCGYNATYSTSTQTNSQTSGEMANLYYKEMNGVPSCSATGPSDCSTQQSSSFFPGPFMHVQTGNTAAYWYGTTYAPNSNGAWIFDFTGGGQIFAPKQDSVSNPPPPSQSVKGYFFWPVLAGNVTPAAVPEPEAWLLMLAGLGMVGTAVARRRQRG